ncbi:hypothetical protein R52603_05748 [Paraburkholderia saeva]|uniref:Uncharacterized protein n=1 Tax=Paraburkholderia saeva TaxID=2777537 RepID=A0A9N8S372_9BURK|nr:hypothetical protein LMG31841_05825 [Paraburkholderia saeva]CAG4928733.1 hypothetical protein R70241_05771 [Paraburkholderia saeva]CAG4928812.1 hypothetical protein R52603_05748 [Paraburkholderia saeva]
MARTSAARGMPQMAARLGAGLLATASDCMFCRLVLGIVMRGSVGLYCGYNVEDG